MPQADDPKPQAVEVDQQCGRCAPAENTFAQDTIACNVAASKAVASNVT